MLANTKIFLIHLSKSRINTLFGQLLESGAGLEMLNPKELGNRWQGVSFVDQDISSQSNILQMENKLKLEKLEKAISTYSSPFSFEDHKESGNIPKILENWQESNLFEAVEKLNNPTIINKKYLQQKLILKKSKNNWSISILKDLKALYTKYEIQSKLSKINSKVFRLNNLSDAYFAVFVIDQKDETKIKELLFTNSIEYEQTSWTKSIVVLPKQSHGILEKLQNSDLISDEGDQKFITFGWFLSFLFSSIMIHDILAGFIILIISLLAYRFKLSQSGIISQIWVGLGSIIFGFLGGSFGGNLLTVMISSQYGFIRWFATGLQEFLSLFQIADWTNSISDFVVNGSFGGVTSRLHFGFWRVFVIGSILTILTGLGIRIFKYFQKNQIKSSILVTLFGLCILFLLLTIFKILPIWIIFISFLGLYIYQKDIRPEAKFLSFMSGRYGLRGITKVFISSLLFIALFGIMIFSSAVINSLNQFFVGNIFLVILINLLFTVLYWQVVIVAVQKTIYENYTKLFITGIDPTKQKIFEPISDYKYWKF